MTDAAAVSIRNVSKTFGKGGTTALQSIELEFQPGEFISLIGPSGCGKSTLLRVIGDLIQPTEGEAVIGGKSAHQARLDRDYGMVFQEATLMDWRTVEKNVSLPLEMMGWDRTARRDRVRELLELVELTGFEGHHPWQLSGGMQQRVAIARALTFKPSLILMDEPFGALDVQTRLGMQNLINELWEEIEGTILFVTHDIPEAVYLADKIHILSCGPGAIVDEIEVDLPLHRTEDLKQSARVRDLETQVLNRIRKEAKGGNVRITT
jgi:NitT/TauT family transport system ATP-binding protein